MKLAPIFRMLAIASALPMFASAQAPQGIYIGSFAGQTDNGGFANRLFRKFFPLVSVS